MQRVLGNLESCCMVGSDFGTESNVELNCLLVLASYRCEIPKGKYVSGTRHVLSVRTSFVQYLCTMKSI